MKCYSSIRNSFKFLWRNYYLLFAYCNLSSWFIYFPPIFNTDLTHFLTDSIIAYPVFGYFSSLSFPLLSCLEVSALTFAAVLTRSSLCLWKSATAPFSGRCIRHRLQPRSTPLVRRDLRIKPLRAAAASAAEPPASPAPAALRPRAWRKWHLSRSCDPATERFTPRFVRSASSCRIPTIVQVSDIFFSQLYEDVNPIHLVRSLPRFVYASNVIL